MAAVPSRLIVCAALLAIFSSPGQVRFAAQGRAAAPSPRPARIVSTVPAATEMLFAMGAGQRVVGVGSYDRFPPEIASLPRVGGLLDPSVEKILSLKPDLVIVYDTQLEFQRQLMRAGIAMFRYTQRDLAQVPTTLRALGARVGAVAAADAAASRFEQQLGAIKARVSGRPQPRTLIVFGRESGAIRRVNASAGYGFLHDLLGVAGGADVLGDMKRESVEMSTEMILVRAPEVIVELRYGEPLAPERVTIERQAWNVLPGVPAVKNNRVYMLFGDEFVVPGPRMVIAAERLARTLHPEVFK